MLQIVVAIELIEIPLFGIDFALISLDGFAFLLFWDPLSFFSPQGLFIE
jgi:hypothetical protein